MLDCRDLKVRRPGVLITLLLLPFFFRIYGLLVIR